MSGNANLVVLVGNLTRDVDVRYTQNQSSVASTAIAVNRKWDGGQETTFVDLVAFGKTADILKQYASKGSSVFIQGRLKLEQWNAQDGSKRSQLKVVVENVQILEFKEQAPQPGDRDYYQDQTPYKPDPDSDIPF